MTNQSEGIHICTTELIKKNSPDFPDIIEMAHIIQRVTKHNHFTLAPGKSWSKTKKSKWNDLVGLR
jgi:hypothetical protein